MIYELSYFLPCCKMTCHLYSSLAILNCPVRHKEFRKKLWSIPNRTLTHLCTVLPLLFTFLSQARRKLKGLEIMLWIENCGSSWRPYSRFARYSRIIILLLTLQISCFDVPIKVFLRYKDVRNLKPSKRKLTLWSLHVESCTSIHFLCGLSICIPFYPKETWLSFVKPSSPWPHSTLFIITQCLCQQIPWPLWIFPPMAGWWAPLFHPWKCWGSFQPDGLLADHV